jgi:hypothetical protein
VSATAVTFHYGGDTCGPFIVCSAETAKITTIFQNYRVSSAVTLVDHLHDLLVVAGIS